MCLRHSEREQIGREVGTARQELSAVRGEAERSQAQIREAREAESASRAELAAVEEELSGLRQEADELSGSLDAARSELAALQEQRAAMDEEAGTAQALTGIEPGRYEAGPVIVEFGSDGQFQMAQRDGAQSVQGRYEVADGVVHLTDVSGDIGRASFPMRCRLTAADGGFRLEAVDGSCQEFAGTIFTR
jgi:septal ring factor EnvC (AmiA/AmiB activator)